MRFFVRVQSIPDAENYGRAQSLHRMDDSYDGLVMERWDREASEWVDNPSLIRYTGISGAEDYFEITSEKAEAILRQWQPNPNAMKVKGTLRRVSVQRGGPGSGHHGHRGRPGEVGGSLPSGKSDIDFFQYQDKNIEHIPKKMGKVVPEGMDYRPGRWLGWQAEGAGDVFREFAKSHEYGDGREIIDWGYVEEKLRRLERDIDDEIDRRLLFEGKLSHEDEAKRQKMLQLWRDFPGDIPPKLDVARQLSIRLLERDLTGTILAIGDIRRVKDLSLKSAIEERHYGPGPHPGTGTPQQVHAGKRGKGGKTEVGITSARPGKPSKQVFNEMRKFEDRLKKLRTVRNPSVKPGLGGWEGGREPTWVVSYEGNGQAIREIAETAKKFEQDAVLFMREASGRGGSPVVTWRFTDPVTPEERDAVENLMVEMGIGGWTWFRTPDGHSSLKAVAVPQWGGDPKKHLSASRRLRQLFQSINMPHEYDEGRVEVDILQREGENAYDEILKR